MLAIDVLKNGLGAFIFITSKLLEEG